MTVELAYQEMGRGEPVVILHGLFGSKRNWGAVAKALAGRFRVFALDLRNHGDSPWVDGMSYAELAGDVEAFLRAHAITPATVIGHSMGGKTAMTLALTRPELIKRLVVVDIAPAPTRKGLGPLVDAMAEVPLIECDTRQDVDAHLAAAVPDARVRQFLMQNLTRENGQYRWRINLAALDAGMADIVDFPAAHQPPVCCYPGPARFIAGGASDYVQPRHTAEIQRLFPKARLTHVPGAGHWLHAEAEGAFLREVSGFLEET
ncbi:MAG: alpha/beta fold hydrolase [Alphaproteobacteria bacterium]|nr:alpha/beta fold hydrolase [Alphaproteobacteria bacterium]